MSSTNQTHKRYLQDSDDSVYWPITAWDAVDGKPTDLVNQKDLADAIKGAEGKTSYTHIAYANSADGKDGFYVGGGRNLLTGTQDWQGKWGNLPLWLVNEEKYEGLAVRKRLIAWYSLGQYYDANPNTTYTFSFYAKASEAGNYLEILTLDKEDWSSPVVSPPIFSNKSITTEWQRYSVTFTTKSSGKIYPSVCSNKDGITIYVAGYNLDEGSVATSWSPAPSEAHPIYMGIYSDNVPGQSTDPSKYIWTLTLEGHPNNLATIDDVKTEIAAIQKPDMSGYLTQASLAGYVVKGELPDFKQFALKTDLPTFDPNTVYTKDEVNAAIAKVKTDIKAEFDAGEMADALAELKKLQDALSGENSQITKLLAQLTNKANVGDSYLKSEEDAKFATKGEVGVAINERLPKIDNQLAEELLLQAMKVTPDFATGHMNCTVSPVSDTSITGAVINLYVKNIRMIAADNGHLMTEVVS